MGMTILEFSVLVNGSPTLWFKAGMGLRQGCPLFPYLFILGSEMLSLAIKRAEVEERFEGFCSTTGATSISHLLFTDDALLICGDSIPDIVALRGVLEQCGGWLAQSVNFTKSSLHVSSKLQNKRHGKRLSRPLGINVVKGTWMELSWYSHLGVAFN